MVKFDLRPYILATGKFRGKHFVGLIHFSMPFNETFCLQCGILPHCFLNCWSEMIIFQLFLFLRCFVFISKEWKEKFIIQDYAGNYSNMCWINKYQISLQFIRLYPKLSSRCYSTRSRAGSVISGTSISLELVMKTSVAAFLVLSCMIHTMVTKLKWIENS